MKTKTGKINSLITVAILAAGLYFTACDDSVTGENNQGISGGSLTIANIDGYDGNFICARGNDASGKELFAAGAIPANGTIRCVQISDKFAVLNVYEVKNGTFSSYSGTAVAELSVFITNKARVAYNEIVTFDENSLPGWLVDFDIVVKPSFVSGKGTDSFH